MSFANLKYREHKTWNPEDLNKKIGQIILLNPVDSDIQEGNYIAQLWFMESDHTMWLLQEWDVRKRK